MKIKLKPIKLGLLKRKLKRNIIKEVDLELKPAENTVAEN